MIDQEPELETYIGRTSYGNMAAMEAALNNYNVLVLPDTLFAKLIMVFPIDEGIVIDSRRDGYHESAVIFKPESFRFVDAISEAEVRFSPSKKGEPPKLLAHEHNPGNLLAQNSRLAIKKTGGRRPLEFRLSIPKALIVIKNNSG